jgi:hypothetical protein
LHVRQSTSGSVKPGDVPGRLPDARVEDDRGVERDDVVRSCTIAWNQSERMLFFARTP